MNKFKATIKEGLVRLAVNSRIKNFFYILAITLTAMAIARLFYFRWTHNFSANIPIKDEIGFCKSFNYALENGFYNAIASGSSIMYNFIGMIIYSINKNMLQSLRLTSLFSMIGIVFTWLIFIKSRLKLNNKQTILILLILLEICSRQHAYFAAINDSLFVFFLSLSLSILLNGVFSQKTGYLTYVLSGLFFGLSFCTRELAIFYLAGFLIIFLIQLKKNIRNIKYFFCWVSFCLLTVLVLNYPSLKEKGSLSEHNKNFDTIGVSWAEINYLSILHNKSKLLYGRDTKNENKIEVEDVIAYKKVHGEHSLPHTYFQAIFWNLSITLKNFFGLIYLSQIPFLIQVGLFYLVFLMPLYTLFKTYFSVFKWHEIAPILFFFSFTICICILPIRHIEFRHFMFFTPFLVACGILNLKEINKVSSEYFLLLNVILITIPNLLLFGIF